jgi:phage-related protein
VQGARRYAAGIKSQRRQPEISGTRRERKYRAVYTVKFENAVYVLHAFQKSPSGIATARTDSELIAKRLRMAREDYEVRYGGTKS